jgi:hypothetical protein
MAKLVRGVAHIKVNGKNFSQSNDGNFDITYTGGVKREYQKSSDGTSTYSEIPDYSKVSGEITTTPGIDYDELVIATNVTITIQLANGSTFVLSNSGYTGDGKISTKEGTFSFEFSGDGTWL